MGLATFSVAHFRLSHFALKHFESPLRKFLTFDERWPQSDQAVLDAANIQPDSWGDNGPNQLVERYQVLANRNDTVWAAPVVSGVTSGLGMVRMPPETIPRT